MEIFIHCMFEWSEIFVITPKISNYPPLLIAESLIPIPSKKFLNSAKK